MNTRIVFVPALLLVVCGLLVGWHPAEGEGVLGLMAPQPLEMEVDAVLYGAAVEEYYRIVTVGDVNGDGAEDLVTARTRHAGLPAEENWIAIVLGRADWPAESRRTDLDRTIPINFPQRRGLLHPDEPDFGFMGLQDLNGDGYDDIMVFRADKKGAERTAQVSVYFGRANMPADIEVERDEPDMYILQPRVGQSPTSHFYIPRPDVVTGFDVDADGDRDLIVFSCGLMGKRYAQGNEGAMFIYLADEGGLKSIDMTVDEPDHVIYGGTDERLGCRGFDGVDGLDRGGGVGGSKDFNNDGRLDMLIGGWDKAKRKQVVRFVLGPDSWPQEGELEDLVTATIYDERKNGHTGASHFIQDLNGDNRVEVKVRAAQQGNIHQTENIWYSDNQILGMVKAVHSDLRIVDSWIEIQNVADIDGDGSNDLVFLVERRRKDLSWEWRMLLGPDESRGELRPKTDPEVGDLYYRIPPRDDVPWWWTGDFTGDDVPDAALVVSDENSPDGKRDAGVIRICGGPFHRGGQPTPTVTVERPTPSEAPPTDTAVPATATATEQPPTATATTEPATPTEPPGWAIFLPINQRNAGL